MQEAEIRRMVAAAGEEITDDQGHVIGLVAQPARFKLDRAYLARGGFLVVEREEETLEYVGTEYDALPHPKTGDPYPAGHSETAWRTASLDEAVSRVLAALNSSAKPSPERELDLRGDVCPITFAKAKIALEEMNLGEVLRVILDYEPATRNVPRSAQMYGDEVLSVAPTGPSTWEVVIRKRVE